MPLACSVHGIKHTCETHHRFDVRCFDKKELTRVLACCGRVSVTCFSLEIKSVTELVRFQGSSLSFDLGCKLDGDSLVRLAQSKTEPKQRDVSCHISIGSPVEPTEREELR